MQLAMAHQRKRRKSLNTKIQLKKSVEPRYLCHVLKCCDALPGSDKLSAMALADLSASGSSGPSPATKPPRPRTETIREYLKLFMHFSDENVNYAQVIKLTPSPAPTTGGMTLRNCCQELVEKRKTREAPLFKVSTKFPEGGDESRMIYRPRPIEAIFKFVLLT